MGALVGWSIAVGYAVVTLFAARWVVGRWARDPESPWYEQPDRRDAEQRWMASTLALMLMAFWPVFLPLLWVPGWLYRPVDRERAVAQRRRAELTAWVDRAADPHATEAERQLAREVVRALRGEEGKT